MKTKLLAATALCVAAVLGAGAASAQAPGYTPPKTAWGAPDLQGFWNNTSITSLQRSPDAKSLVVNEKEANRLVNRNILIVLTKEDDATNGTDPNNTKILEDKNNDRGYNSFWIDPGSKLATVKGELRTSWITEPASGRLPYKPDAARGGGYAITNFDGPETRPMAERCVLGFSGLVRAGDDERHVQQHDAVRADAEQRDDQRGDEPRCADHPDRRQQGGREVRQRSQVGRRLCRLLRGRQAGGGDHQRAPEPARHDELRTASWWRSSAAGTNTRFCMNSR